MYSVGGVIFIWTDQYDCFIYQRADATRILVKNNAFPQPLPRKKRKDIYDLMAEGDRSSRNLLIEHNLRLVAHIVKKFDNTGEDLEDLISIGTIGLIKAIESFQPDKGTKLLLLQPDV